MSGTANGLAASGGCHRKLGFADLRTLLASSHSSPLGCIEPVMARVDLGDAVGLQMRNGKGDVAVSSDLIFDFPVRRDVYGAIGATHALSDLYACLADPIWATVTLGVTPEQIAGGEAAEILGGVASTLADNGVVHAGGHTVLVDQGFLGLTVVGTMHPTFRPVAAETGDLLLLSKPLGAGMAITAATLGVAGSVDDDVVESMADSNRVSCDFLCGLEGRFPGALHGVTDVSGFGFVNALAGLCSSSVVDIWGCRMPRFGGASAYAGAQCWSRLMDENVSSSLEFVDYGAGPDAAVLAALLNDPQTSGGLLAVVAPAAVCALPDGLAAAGFRVVGEVVEARADRAAFRVVTPAAGAEAR